MLCSWLEFPNILFFVCNCSLEPTLKTIIIVGAHRLVRSGLRLSVPNGHHTSSSIPLSNNSRLVYVLHSLPLLRRLGPPQTANKNLLHDLTECEKLAEDERDALQQTLQATRTEKQRVSDRHGERRKKLAARDRRLCAIHPVTAAVLALFVYMPP